MTRPPCTRAGRRNSGAAPWLRVGPQMRAAGVVSSLVLCAMVQGVFASDFEKDRQERERRAKSQSHCVGDERVVFSCLMRGKAVSVCASPELTARAGYVQYRYGPLGKVKLALPAKETFRPSEVEYFSYPGGSNREYYLKFANGGNRYFIRFSSVRGDDDPKGRASTRIESAGLVVTSGRKKIFSRACSSPEFDDNVGEHFWAGAVTRLEGEEAGNPYDE